MGRRSWTPPSGAGGLLGDGRFEFVSGAYDEVLWGLGGEEGWVDAVLFDLGLSSFQIDEPGRGFSYTREGPLDMRMDPRSGVSAAEFLNGAEVEDLARVLTVYGDVSRREARRVARGGARRGAPGTTTHLFQAVRAGLGWGGRG